MSNHSIAFARCQEYRPKKQGFPILASFPLRGPIPEKKGECAVSGGARHGTLTKKGAGWGRPERIGKPWPKKVSVILLERRSRGMNIFPPDWIPTTGNNT